MSNERFKGFTYNRLSREYEWFTVPPSSITPFQLIKWAFGCGGWTLEDDPNTGDLSFLGPPGPTPWISSSTCIYPDDTIALQVMRAHYSHWWGQKENVKKAFELFSAQSTSEGKPGVEKTEDDFKLPDDIDEGFKGTEED